MKGMSTDVVRNTINKRHWNNTFLAYNNDHNLVKYVWKNMIVLLLSEMYDLNIKLI